jgi:hypothetical protein
MMLCTCLLPWHRYHIVMGHSWLVFCTSETVHRASKACVALRWSGVRTHTRECLLVNVRDGASRVQGVCCPALFGCLHAHARMPASED